MSAALELSDKLSDALGDLEQTRGALLVPVVPGEGSRETQARTLSRIGELLAKERMLHSIMGGVLPREPGESDAHHWARILEQRQAIDRMWSS